MVLRALLLGGCIALAGCQSTAVVEQVKPKETANKSCNLGIERGFERLA